MYRSVAIALTATVVATVGATLWVPVEPRARETVVGVIERQDGTREPITARLPPPTFDWDWVWREFGERSRWADEYDWTGCEIGAAAAPGKPEVRWTDAGLQIAAIAILGSLLIVLVHTLARRRAALLATLPGAVPMDDPRPHDLEPLPARPVSRTPRLRATLAASAVALGLAAVTVGPCRPGPPTVARWVVPGEVPAYIRGGRLSHVWVNLSDSRTPPPNTDPEALVLADEPGLAGPATARARLRALAAERKRPLSNLDAFVDADPAVRYGRFVAIMDLFRSEGLWRVSPSFSPNMGAASQVPVGNPTGTDCRLVRVQTFERHVVASDASIDIHIGPNRTLRVRPPGARSAASPVAMTLGQLAGLLRANVGRFRNSTNPVLADCVVFVHADTEAPMAHVQPACHTCMVAGYVRLAFVVQPPAAPAGGR